MSHIALRRWTRWVLVGVAVLLGVVVVAFALLQTSPVATWAVRRLLLLVPLNPGHTLDVGRVSGNWITGLQLEAVRLRRAERDLAHLDRLRVGYDPRRLRGAETRLRFLSIDGARAVARRERNEWDLANVLRSSPDTAGGRPLAVDSLELRNIELAAELGPDSTLRVRDLTLRAHDLVMGDVAVVTIDTIAAQIAPPGQKTVWFALAGRGGATAEEFRLDPLRITTERSELAGAVVLPRRWDEPRLVDRLAVQLDATPLALGDVAVWVPGVRSEGDLRLSLRASGDEGMATGRLTGRLDEATVTLDGRTRVGPNAPIAIHARGAVRALDPARLHTGAPAGRFNGDLEADLQGRSLREVNGQVNLDIVDAGAREPAFERIGLRAAFTEGRADLALRGAVGPGTVTATGWARPFDSIPSYRLTGEARRLPGSDSLVRQLVGPESDPVLVVGFALGGSGVALQTARATGRVDLSAVRRDGERVSLGRAPLTLANGRLELRPELQLADGRITGIATARFDDPMTYEVRHGRIDGVDLGRLLGDTVAAPLSGRFSLTGRGTAPTEAIATMRLELDELKYGTRRIDAVTATGRLDRGRALLQAGGVLQGGRLALEMTARPFDSTKTFTIRRASLERADLGTFLGQPNFAGPVTLRATGDGQMRGRHRVFRGRVTVEPSRLGRIEVRAGTLHAKLNDRLVTYDAAIQTNGGALALAGDAATGGTALAVTVHRGSFDSLNLATLLGQPRLESGLNGRFTASTAGAGLDSMQAKLDLDLLPSRVADATLHQGRLALAVDGGAIQGDVQVESSDGRLVGQAALQAVTDSAGLASLGGTITATGALRDARLDTFYVALQPAAGAIDVDTVIVRSNVALLDGSGSVALRESAGIDTLRLVGHARELAPVTALAGLDTVTVDSAEIRLVVAGPAYRWQLTGEAEAHRLLYAGKLAEQVRLRANATLDSTRVAGMSGELRLEGGAMGRLQINEAAVTARYDSVVSLQATATLRDSVRFAAVVQGTVVGDTVRTTVERLELVEGGRTWTLERPAGLLVRPRVEVDGLALHTGERRIMVDGVFDRRGSSDLTLRVVGVDLDVFRELGLSPIPGRLDGHLRLAGPAAAPKLDGRFGLTVRRGATELGRIATDLSWTDAGLRLDAVAAPNQGGRLTANGTLPWRLTFAPPDTGASVGVTRGSVDTLGLVIRADSFDLAFFDPLLPPENAKDLRGALALDTRVSGTTEEPRVDGSVRLTGLGVELPPLGLTYEGGELVGDLSGTDFRVTSLRLRTDDDEELVGQGTVRFRPLTNPTLDFTAELRDFRISNSPTLHASARGPIRLSGTAEAPSLTGNLRLGRTEVFQGAEAKVAAVKEVELTEADMQELAQHFGAAALARADEGPGLVERFRLDVDVRLPRNVWFRRRKNPKADIELSGQIKIRQEPGQEMQFFGRVEPTPNRGGLDVYGRNFRLTGGEIVLAGPVDSMTLDVTAQYQVPTQAGPDAGILIDVAAKGRADSLSLDFTSEPALDQDDIIAYIVTGRPASESPFGGEEGQSPEEAGAELAFSGLSERLAGAAGQSLGLDVFQIKQDGLRGLTLTAGRYVAPRIFLSLLQPIQLSSDAQQTPGSNLGPGFELEYSAKRWLRANLRGGSLPPRFFLRGRHAY